MAAPAPVAPGQVVAYDTTGDGIADTNMVAVDVNGDGIVDQMVPIQPAAPAPVPVAVAAPVVAQPIVAAAPQAGGGALPSYNEACAYPGLEPLVAIESLQVKQKVDLLEAVANAVGYGCCEQANTYEFFDGANASQALFEIKEQQGDCQQMCCRACCNPYHSMELHMTTKQQIGAVPAGQLVYKIERPFKGCGFACFPCCLQEWIVKAADDKILGRLTQPLFGGCFCPVFHMLEGENENAEPFWNITGPHCIGELCCEAEFPVIDAKSEQEVAKITKLSSGAVKELMTDADNFEFRVPKDESVERKATAIAGIILLDYYFFEDGGAFECNPGAAPGEQCCKVNLCTQYCCGCKETWALACNQPEPGA